VNEMKPIETTHNGITYRSRLEARWALFFEQVFPIYKIHYEPEGYILQDGTWYLPDFEIIGEIKGEIFRLFIEIKPINGADEEAKRKCLLFSQDLSITILEGTPDNHKSYEFRSGSMWQSNGFPVSTKRAAQKSMSFQFRRA
jgi:hypothetical protein